MTGVILPASTSSFRTSRSSLVHLRHERNDPLTDEPVQHERSEQMAERPEQSAALSSDDDERSLRFERAPQRPQRPVPDVVDDQVVARSVPAEVVDGVVDDAVGADRVHRLDVRRAAHARDLRTERLGDLHREGAHAAGGTVDQHALPCLDPAVVAESLQRGDAGQRDRSGLLESERRRLRREALCGSRRVLGKGAAGRAEHLVAWLELGHVLADRLDRPRDVAAAHAGLRSPQPSHHRAGGVRLASQHPPVNGVDGRRPNPDEHAVGLEGGPVDLLQLQDVR